MSLAFVPKDRFHLNSWHLNDGFTSYCIDVVTNTIINLIKSRYIEIVVTSKPFQLFGITLFERHKYSAILSKKPPNGFTIGWFEEKLFEHCNYISYKSLDATLYELFNDIFDGNQRLTNPGKVFTLELLKHQRMNLFEFKCTKSWILDRVTLWYNQQPMYVIKTGLPQLNGCDDLEMKKLRKVVSRQLSMFQDLD